MKHALAILISSTALTAAPHGGSYRGPGNVVPNSGSKSNGAPVSAPIDTSGGSTAGSGSSTGPATPAAGGTGSGFGGAAGTSGSVPRGVMIGEDLSQWQYWWEFNKDAYLLLRQSLQATRIVTGSDEQFMGVRRDLSGYLSAPATVKDIEERVMPALFGALNSDNRDIVSSCLVGLAKIGRDPKGTTLLKTFTGYLSSRDQEIRETAALAMGISQQLEAAATLIALATDTTRGQELTRRGRVDARTRAFATYGIGLLAHKHADIKLRMAALRASQSILRDKTLVDRNVKVAAINALGLFRVDDNMSTAVQKLSVDVVRVLLAFYDEDSSRGHDVIRAHVPTAVARILGHQDSEMNRALKVRWIAELGAEAKISSELQCSIALALGQLARSPEARKSDAPVADALRTYSRSGRSPQARYFSLIALAQIGGNGNRAFLLGSLKRGSKSLERPWVGLALGMLVHRNIATHGAGDRVVADALLDAFVTAKSPYVRGAMAIGLGLCGHVDAAPQLLKHLKTHGHQDEMSGYLCLGLALMDEQKSIDAIVEVLDQSVRRPHRMRMASVALGKLGDRKLTKRLLSMLAENEPSLAKMAAVASALAQIGDRQSIASLIEMLSDKNLPQISRAFAAVALGGIADKESEPWNAKIGININYRAAVETLVESGAGVLEIL